MRYYKIKTYLLFTISFIFFSLVYVSTLDIFSLRIIQFKSSILLLFSIILLILDGVKTDSTKENKIIISLMIFMFMVITISSIINNNFSIYNILVLISIIILLKLKYKTIKIIFVSAVISFLPFFIAYGFSSSINSFAITTAIISILALMLLSQSKYRFITFPVFVIVVISLFIQSSRTSMLGFLVGSFILFISNKKSLNNINVQKLLIAISIIIVSIVLFNQDISHFFLDKWSDYSGFTYDLLGTRGVVWEEVIKNNITWFGEGENFFFITFSIEDGHNIFITSLGNYGIISTLTLLIVFLYSIYLILFKHFNIYVFSLFMSFTTISIFENTLFVDLKAFAADIIFILILGTLTRYNYLKGKK